MSTPAPVSTGERLVVVTGSREVVDETEQKVNDPKLLDSFFSPPVLSSSSTSTSEVSTPAALVATPATSEPVADTAVPPLAPPKDAQDGVPGLSTHTPVDEDIAVPQVEVAREDTAHSILDDTERDADEVMDSQLLQEPFAQVEEPLSPLSDVPPSPSDEPQTATETNLSLNKLSAALELLNDPSRPSTSMGFHRTLSNSSYGDSSFSNHQAIDTALAKGKGKERPRSSSSMSMSAIPIMASAAKGKAKGKAVPAPANGQKKLKQTTLMLPPKTPAAGTRSGLRSTGREAPTGPSGPMASAARSSVAKAHGLAVNGATKPNLSSDSKVRDVYSMSN